MQMPRPVLYSLILAVGIFLGVEGRIVWIRNTHPLSNVLGAPIRQGTSGLINPLLSCEVAQRQVFRELTPLKEKLTTLTDLAIQKKEISYASVYFRDLTDSSWMGIKENDLFYPSSLLKVPLMIAYFKAAENDPYILSEKVKYTALLNRNVKEDIKPQEQLVIGESYTVEELIRRMIVFSDNDAATILFERLDPTLFQEVFSDLGMNLPPAGSTNDFLSPKSYSLFFRVLYNATYLNRDFSEKALELLVQSDFKEGLLGGVPGDIKVAHKFGENEKIIPEGNSTGIHQLHDCGIVYRPDHPYLLCVMTQGNDLNTLKKTIESISQTAYQTVVAVK